MRAIVASALAFGLVAALATLAWAAPSLSIVDWPRAPTNDTTPTFAFTVDSAVTVECAIDPVGQDPPTYAACSGATSHTPADPLPEGDYVFSVRAVDEAAAEAVDSRAFTVDLTPPQASIDPTPSSPTNNTTPTFAFSAESGASVRCSIDQGTREWVDCTTPTSHTPAEPLTHGTWTFRVQARDAAQNETEVSRTIVVDTAAPSLSIDSGPRGPTNIATPTFGFTAEPGASVQCSIDQGTPAYGGCTSARSHTATLTDGSYVFHVQATDDAGNVTEQSRAFTVDTRDPAVGGISGPSGPTNVATPSFDFTADADATVQCSVDQGTPAYGDCTSARSHTADPLPDGDYTFRVQATDAAGNQAEATQDFSVDSAAPSLSIDSGPRGATNDATPSFEFTAAAGTTVECAVDQQAYGPCTGTATHVVGAALADGEHSFHVRARDAAGNDAETSQSFTVDTVPPSLSIGFGPSGTTSDSTPLFGFSAETGATVQCSIDQGTPAYGPCASAATHAAAAPLADGAYVFHVRATDGAGNQTAVTRAFTVDTVPDAPAPETPRADPAPPLTPAPAKPQLMSPFPLVRISGTLTATGARIRLLTVRAPRGALVRVTVSPACSAKRRAARRCRVLQAAGTVGRREVIGFRSVERAYRSGTVIVVRVWSADRIGKYTRFTIVRGKAPRRVDQCLVPAATRGSRCPSA